MFLAICAVAFGLRADVQARVLKTNSIAIGFRISPQEASSLKSQWSALNRTYLQDTFKSYLSRALNENATSFPNITLRSRRVEYGNEGKVAALSRRFLKEINRFVEEVGDNGKTEAHLRDLIKGLSKEKTKIEAAKFVWEVFIPTKILLEEMENSDQKLRSSEVLQKLQMALLEKVLGKRNGRFFVLTSGEVQLVQKAWDCFSSNKTAAQNLVLKAVRLAPELLDKFSGAQFDVGNLNSPEFDVLLTGAMSFLSKVIAAINKNEEIEAYLTSFFKILGDSKKNVLNTISKHSARITRVLEEVLKVPEVIEYIRQEKLKEENLSSALIKLALNLETLLRDLGART